MDGNTLSPASNTNTVGIVNRNKGDRMFDAIDKSIQSLNDHIQLTNERLKSQEAQINAITDRSTPLNRLDSHQGRR